MKRGRLMQAQKSLDNDGRRHILISRLISERMECKLSPRSQAGKNPSSCRRIKSELSLWSLLVTSPERRSNEPRMGVEP